MLRLGLILANLGDVACLGTATLMSNLNPSLIIPPVEEQWLDIWMEDAWIGVTERLHANSYKAQWSSLCGNMLPSPSNLIQWRGG